MNQPESHVPEPWYVERQNDGTEIAILNRQTGQPVLSIGFIKAVDAERVVDCVNFLEGVSTGQLKEWLAEGKTLKDLVDL